MKFLVLILSLSFTQFSYAKDKKRRVPSTIYKINNILNKLKKKTFEKELRDFVSCCRPSRMVGTKGHEASVKYLVDRIKEVDPSGKNLLLVDEFNPDIDYATSLYKADFKSQIEGKFKKHDPTYKKWDKFTKTMVKTFNNYRTVKGKNIIWEKKGYINPDQVIIIGAHYDTISHDKETNEFTPTKKMPGADDNGSGVAILLSLIKIISDFDLPKTVRVVFFDYEEMGFLGTRAYVQKYKVEMNKQKIEGYINLEMLGNDTKFKDLDKKYGNMKVYIRKPNEKGHYKDKKLADKLTVIGKKISRKVKFELDANGFNRSDNINFWDEGFASVTFSQNWERDFNLHYHTDKDIVEAINFKTLYASFKYITGAVIAWNLDIVK